MKEFLKIDHITKTFGTFNAVDGVSLSVAKGEFLTFLGPSGSGKSTLLYMIAGLERASSGDIRLGDRSLLSIPPHRRNIGMVFQRYTLIPHMSVRDNVGFPLRVRRMDPARVRAKVDDMLRLVHLTGFEDRRPDQLSGGQQQRVALARALSYDPPILLMDEPLAALDKRLKDEIQDEIRRIHRETGVTILYVTHDQEEALRLSDRIAVFNQGRIEQIATGRTLYEDPDSRFVANFVGNSNFLSVNVVTVLAQRASVCLRDGTFIDGVRISGKVAAGSRGTMLIRPERISIGQASGIPVSVKDVTYLGENLQILAETRWGQQLSLRPPMSSVDMAKMNVGAEVRIVWQSEHGIVFNEIA